MSNQIHPSSTSSFTSSLFAKLKVTVELDGQSIDFVPTAQALPPTPPARPDVILEAPATDFVHFDRPTKCTLAGKSVDVFNAAVHFDRPGQYMIQSRRIRVDPSLRREIYVSPEGSDAADGTSPDSAVKSLVRAFAMLGDNCRVLLARGHTYAVDSILSIRQKNVVLTGYGDANLAQPIILWTGSQPFGCLVELLAPASRVVIEDITFDTRHPTPAFDHRNMPDAIRLSGGSQITIRRCTFNHVGNAINGNGAPADVLVEQCTAPLVTGLRAYFAWVQGKRWTFLGNRVPNSTREHIIRVGGGEDITIVDNDFANIDRSTAVEQPDPLDGAKNVLTIQRGGRAVIAHNRIDGRIGIGPLGSVDGRTEPNARWDICVLEANVINGQIVVHHGTTNVVVRHNRIRADNQAAISVEGVSPDFQRTTVGTRIEHNVVRNESPHGALLRVASGAEGVSLIGNRYDAPRFETGGWTSAFVYVEAADLSSFKEIRDNNWPASVKTQAFARGGVFYVWPTWADQRGYLTLDDWNRLPQVADDRMV